jgi:hypothetical protein
MKITTLGGKKRLSKKKKIIVVVIRKKPTALSKTAEFKMKVGHINN